MTTQKGEREEALEEAREHVRRCTGNAHLMTREEYKRLKLARGDDIGGVGPSGKSKAEQAVDKLIDDLQRAKTADEINALLSSDKAAQQITWLMERRPEEHARLYRAVNAHRTKVDGDMPDIDDLQREAA